MPEDFDWAAAHARLETMERFLDAGASPERVREVLEARARRFARPPAPKAARHEGQEVVAFVAAGQLFGIEPAFVQEVLRPCVPTELPGSRPCICGVVHYRGRLIVLLDLPGLVRTEAGTTREAKAPVVVVEALGLTFGIRAESISGMTRVSRETEGLPSATPGSLGGSIRQAPEGLVMVLDIEGLASDPRITVNEEAR